MTAISKYILVLASLLFSPLIAEAQVPATLDEAVAPGRNFDKAPNYPTAWLPTDRVARAWEAMLTEKTFER